MVPLCSDYQSLGYIKSTNDFIFQCLKACGLYVLQCFVTKKKKNSEISRYFTDDNTVILMEEPFTACKKYSLELSAHVVIIGLTLSERQRATPITPQQPIAASQHTKDSVPVSPCAHRSCPNKTAAVVIHSKTSLQQWKTLHLLCMEC